MERDASYWIEKLELLPHPEGGYFRRTYRSPETIEKKCLPGRFPGERILVSTIYYLLPSGQFSAIHRLKSVEIWHFHAGDPLSLFILGPNGTLHEKVLGDDPEKGCSFQAAIEPGCWFGAAHTAPARFTLVGCTVAPGFEYEDMEFADRSELLRMYPQHEKIIKRLTRNPPAGK